MRFFVVWLFLLLTGIAVSDTMIRICLQEFPCKRGDVCERCVQRIEGMDTLKHVGGNVCEMKMYDGTLVRINCPLTKRLRKPEDSSL